MKLVTIVAISAILVVAGCSKEPATAKTTTAEVDFSACTRSYENGVYRLGGHPCPLYSGPLLSRFIAEHPELDVVAISQVSNTGEVLVATKQKAKTQ